jgi:hypothetical protein
MAPLFTVLGVAVPAVSLWLVGRIINRGERWAMWTGTACLLVLVAYPLSYAPMIRYQNGQDWFGEIDGCIWTDESFYATPQIYRPLEWLIDETPCRTSHRQWAGLWRAERTCDDLNLRRRIRRIYERLESSSRRN